MTCLERWKSTLETASDWWAVLSHDDLLAWRNAAWRAMSPHASHTITLATMAASVSPPEARRVWEALSAAFKSGRPQRITFTVQLAAGPRRVAAYIMTPNCSCCRPCGLSIIRLEPLDSPPATAPR